MIKNNKKYKIIKIKKGKEDLELCIVDPLQHLKQNKKGGGGKHKTYALKKVEVFRLYGIQIKLKATFFGKRI